MISSLLFFFLPESSYIELELESGGLQEGHEVGGAPPPPWLGCGPAGIDRLLVFFIISKNSLLEVSGHSENFCFCT